LSYIRGGQIENCAIPGRKSVPADRLTNRDCYKQQRIATGGRMGRGAGEPQM